MPTIDEKLQQLFHEFEERRDHVPVGTRQVCEWAVSQCLLSLPQIDPLDVLARRMASALRLEIRTDSKGRRYRVNHAARITTDGVQFTFWAMMGFAPRSHMEISFAQRREQIIGDCVQLKTDVDAYNDMNRGKEQDIQLVLDFTDDVAEREIAA